MTYHFRPSTAPRTFSIRCLFILCLYLRCSPYQTDFYDAWAPPSIGYVGHFPTRDEKEHLERRRIVNNVYSMSSVLESEKAIDACTQLFCETMRDVAKEKSVIDLSLWINM